MNDIEKIIEVLRSERIEAEIKRMEALAVAHQWSDKIQDITRSIERLTPPQRPDIIPSEPGA